jgi:hypothetical protein
MQANMEYIALRDDYWLLAAAGAQPRHYQPIDKKSPRFAPPLEPTY